MSAAGVPNRSTKTLISHVDHVVVAVPDLEGAIESYRALGIDVQPGGCHPGLGTSNAIARFGRDYLELLAVDDVHQARSNDLIGRPLVEFLHRAQSGFVAYCLATRTIEGLAHRSRDAGISTVGPLSMRRQRPDGRVLEWRMLVHGGRLIRTPYPFEIEWLTSDQDRLRWEAPRRHLLGCTGFAGVAIVVRDLHGIADDYRKMFGFDRALSAEVPQLTGRRIMLRTAGLTIDLLSPSGPGPLAAMLESNGEGLYEVVLQVEDLSRALTFLRGKGIRPVSALGRDAGWLLPIETALGARFILVES